MALDVVRVTPPGSDEEVRLRYPTFAEWHGLAKSHREVDGVAPSAELIAKTISTCLADENGKPLGTENSAVMKWPHRKVMWLYQRCWETVLRSDDELVAEVEKNSEAGQD